MVKHAAAIRLAAYYGALIAGGYFIYAMFPALFQSLPFGGVADLAAAGAAADPFERIISGAASPDRFYEARTLVFGLIGAVLCILPILWVYEATHKKRDRDPSLFLTVLLLPLIVAGVVLIVQQSLALAFSLAGIVAAVQFRRALKSTSDSLFIFAAIAVGLSVGVRSLEIALIVSTMFNIVAIGAHYAGYSFVAAKPKKKKSKKNKKKKQRQIEEAPMPAAVVQFDARSRQPLEQMRSAG